MGVQPQLLQLLREREIETQLGQVQMNCEMCKFRLAHAHNDHGHHHDHPHNHAHASPDRDADPDYYHRRIWQAP